MRNCSAMPGLTPAGIDAADGYVHFSDAAQLPATLDAHYHGHDDLMILALDAAACGAICAGSHRATARCFRIFMGRLRKIWWVRASC